MSSSDQRVLHGIDDSNELSRQPRYLQLASELEETIKRNLQPGDYLDSEHALAKRYQVNRHTIRRAIEQLERAGLVVRQQGVGTQVVSNQMDYLLNASGKFTKNLNELGKKAHAQLVSVDEILFSDAPINVQRYFDFRTHEHATIAQLTTLRYMENLPVCLIYHYVSNRSAPDIAKTYQGGSLHRHFSEHYQLQLQRSQINVSAKLTNAQEALALKCAVNSPLLILQSINATVDNNQVVEVSISHSRSDRLQYQITF